MSPRLIHYSEKPLEIEVREESEVNRNGKPKGLWVSVDEEWKEWCEGESFGLERLACQTEVILHPEANILRLSTIEEVGDFTKKYLNAKSPMLKFNKEYIYDQAQWDLWAIDWEKVMSEYQGIILAPYMWECRFSLMWYGTWDCASGCIWDVKAIKELVPMEMKDAA